MQCYDARVASFAGVTRPKRAVKVAWPLKESEYPHLTPKALAEAGFYHAPGADEDGWDMCRCFCCEILLGGWDQDDDPFVEHVKRDGNCAWMQIVCRNEVDRQEGGKGRLRTTFPDADSLPQSDSSAAMREDTFRKWWPHKRPSAKEVAKGGFIYAPSKASPDGTQCPLCLYEVVDWEETDDPWAVHHRKEPDCPFFTATVAGKKAPSKAKGRTTTTRRGRSASTAAAREPEPKEEEGDGSLELPDPKEMEKEAMKEEEAPAPRRRGRPPKASVAASTTSEAPSTRLAKSTSTRATSSRRKTAATKAKEAEAEVEEEKEEKEEPKEEPKRATKPLPRKRTTRQTTADAEAESLAASVSEPPVPKPRGRPKKVVADAASAPSSRATPASTSTRATKSTASRAKAAKPLAQDSIANVPAPFTLTPLKSPSVREAVASMVREASPVPERPAAPAASEPAKSEPAAAPAMAPLTDDQRKLTLEEYIRQQYALRASEMQADGEAMIQKFEARAREARATLERG